MLALLAGSGLLTWRMVRLDDDGVGSAVMPPVFWATLMLAVCQYENLELMFQVQFPLACFAAGLAILFLVQATRHVRLRAAGLACAAGVCGIVAAFSMSIGVLLAPCLFVLLGLRRASWVVWAVFAPLSILGVVLYFAGHAPLGRADVPVLDWHLTVERVIYSFNFLASSLGAYGFVTQAGALGLAAFCLVCFPAVRRRIVGRRIVPSGDAALMSLGLLAVLCAPAGTLTGRLLMGRDAALGPRYATMSLLFAAALLGLSLRRAGRRTAQGWTVGLVPPAVAVSFLILVNAPVYEQRAASLARVAQIDAGLIVNNVGVEGPAPPTAFQTIDFVRADILSLHAHRLNMFSASAGTPAAVLSALQGARDGGMAVCRGFVDDAYAVDETGFLVSGWAADPAGRHGVPWIAALDAKGELLGVAQSLYRRDDLRAALKPGSVVYGFQAGFRLRTPLGGDEARAVSILGVMPGGSPAICRLDTAALVGPTLVEPVSKLSDLQAAALSSPAVASGVIPWPDKGFCPGGPVPGRRAGWDFARGRGGPESLQFRLAPSAASGQALVVPFFYDDLQPGRSIRFVMADGTRFETVIAVLWLTSGWDAAVVPAAVLALHGGAVAVDVVAAQGGGLLVGSPMTAFVQAEWSKLF